MYALAWADKTGSRVFPVLSGTKKPRDKLFYNSATNDPDAILALFKGRSDYNVGILCDDLLVVDCDIKNGIDGHAAFLGLDEMPIEAFATLRVKTPNGYQYHYSNPTGKELVGRAHALADKAGNVIKNIDTRSWHNFAMAPGSRFEGKYYTLDQDGPILDCPEFIIKQALPKSRELKGTDVEYDDVAAIEGSKRYLERQPGAKQGEGGDQHTLNTAYFLRDEGVSEDTAYQLMSEFWNHKCEPPWDDEGLARKVANAFKYAIGTQGGNHPLTAYAGVTWLADSPSDASWTWHGEPWDSNQQWLFYQMLPAVGVCLLTGPPGSGKSFLSTFIAEAIALGTPFFGVEPDNKGGTIILSAEAYGGLPNRLAALGRDMLNPVSLPIGGTMVSNLKDRAAWEKMRVDLRGAFAKIKQDFEGEVRCVVLDTLSASGLIDDENDNSQCAKAMKLLGDLAIEFHVLVIVLHHPPKSGTGLRGGSALLGAADYVLSVEVPPDKPFKKLLLDKARDAHAPRGLGTFTLKKLVLGEDSRGRPVTTAYVVDNGSEAAKSIAPAHYDNFIQAFSLARALEYNITDPVPLAEVQEQLLLLAPRSNDKSFAKCWAYGVALGAFELDRDNPGEETIREL